MYTKNKMNCPSCGTSINVDQILVDQFEQSIRLELESELTSRKKEFESEKKKLDAQTQILRNKLNSVDELVETQIKKTLSDRQKKLTEEIRLQLESEKQLELQELENELSRKSNQLREMNQTKAQLKRLQREMEEKEAEIILRKEEELNQKLKEARLSIKEQLQQESFLKIKEREKVITDLKKQLDLAQRRAEQGSMQLQGEVQEVELEELLSEFYPFDKITRTGKGVNGADVLQEVLLRGGSEVGKIYFESKRTKSFQQGWIDKLKQDNLSVKADVLVIVSRVLPEGITTYGIVDGVWVCALQHVKELTLVLRYGLLKVHEVKTTQTGKESKMELLYGYLTSEEFKSVFESIITGFKGIQENHASEKLKVQRLWKQREKQLEQVLRDAVEFYGSLRGIAGDSILTIPMLELQKAS